MISVSLQPRPAETADGEQIANLMFFEARVHRHLDWRTPLEWLGSPHYWVLEDQGRIIAALACPQDPPGVAWVRLFTHVSRLSGPEAWSPLWEAARTEIIHTGGAQVVAIAVKPWFQELLKTSGFEELQSIILLEWKTRFFTPRPLPNGIEIRPMLAEDLPAVADADADAFEPLWHNSIQALQKAFAQAIFATVSEEAGRVVGDQISTGNMLGAHLARLGVRKEAQGRGIGSALVGDLTLRLNAQNLPRLTVNTQADNAASLSLYQKLGFVRTGEQYPVFIYQL